MYVDVCVFTLEYKVKSPVRISRKNKKTQKYTLKLFAITRSSCPAVVFKKSFLKNLANLTGNTCLGVSFLIKFDKD